jgi:hypothetical protein
MITRTVAFPGVSSDIRGVNILWFVAIIFSSISGCSSKGHEKAMRPYAAACSTAVPAIYNPSLHPVKKKVYNIINIFVASVFTLLQQCIMQLR